MRVVSMVVLALMCAFPLCAELGQIPEGFTPIYNGKNLDGWHMSKTAVHGSTGEFRVLHGLIVATQRPREGAKGTGGVLLTDKKYKNVEVYMEVWPDFGCDSGLFLRASEAAEAYQVTLDYLPGGGMGGVYGEGLKGVGGQSDIDLEKLTPEEIKELMAKMSQSTEPQPWEKHWKREAWNSIRARIEGSTPHIQVWINDEKVTDFQDTANHAAGGAEDGSIGIQVHYSGEMGGLVFDRWVDGGFWRWRNIAVKELP